MAQRQLYNQEFNSVAIPQGRMHEAQAITGAVEQIGLGLIQHQEKQDELKMTKFSSEAEQAILAKSEELRINNMDNPTSPKAQQEFEREYNKIFSEYDKNFSKFSIGKWKMLRDTSKQQFIIANQKWAIAQNAKNAQTNLSSGITTALETSYGLGMSGDIDGALSSAQTKEILLREAVKGILSESQINEDMKNFQSDYMKNFVLGLAEKNPEQAFSMLENEQVKKTLGNSEIHETLKKVVAVNKSQSELGLYRKQLQNHAQYDLEAKKLNIGQQLAKLQEGSKSGEFDMNWAESKEAVILSEKKIDAITQVEKHGEFLTRKEDILSMYENNEIDEKEYLREVSKFETDMNKAIEQGEIREYDGEKTLNSLRNKLGEATSNLQGSKKWGWQFSERKAYEGFKKELPAMQRNKAKRDFFDSTDGKDFDDKQLKDEYNKILIKYKNDAIDIKVSEENLSKNDNKFETKIIRGKKFKKVNNSWQMI